ncbi:MAG: DNA repair exonuclease, partial [Planctomycetota bacterium]
APCSPVQLTDKGYDYWALGHIHTRNNHAIEGGPPIVFSGNIQGRHIGELGAKGCVLIEIDSRQQCRFDFHPVDVLRFVLCELDVSELKHVDEVLDAFQLWLTESIERADGRLLVVRVRLSGITSIHQSLHRQADSLRADLQAITISTAGEQAWFEEVRLSTSAGLIDARADGSTDDDFFADDASPLASIEHVLHQWQSGVLSHELIEKELSGLAKKLPRELKSSETTTTLSFNDPVWIRELVESSAAEVLGRLQGDDQ